MARTLESIYNETPEAILWEIIVVDDGSAPPLATVLTDFPKVKVIRQDHRQGLIKSKVNGGNAAVGDAIMFLDGHVKPEPGWALPILRHMNTNYKRVVVPIIPILSGETWKPNLHAFGVKMMFDWSLKFNWFEDGNDLVPCMSGGLFGITRRWWHESGEYDFGMNQWGAENIEQSIRIWTCGGEIYVARDSKVSHVFRDSFPYSVNNTEIYINKVRTVAVWFDEYQENFYRADPGATTYKRYVGNISGRLQLKKDLHCKSFGWYMKKFEKVFRQKHMLPMESFLIRDTQSGMCVEAARESPDIAEAPCDTASGYQRWTELGQHGGLRNMESDMCLDANAGVENKAGAKAFLYTCMGTNNRQQAWSLANGQIKWVGGFCVEAGTEEPLKLTECREKFLQERGRFEKYDKKV